MDIEINHKEYNKNIDIWVKNQDVVDGQEAVKRHDLKLIANKHCGDVDIFDYYLPPTGGQIQDPIGTQLYKRYLKNALFPGFTGRTVESYEGMIFSEEPKKELPKDLEEILGASLDTTAKSILNQVIVKNRYGVLVDAPGIPPEVDENNLSIQDKADLGLNPYMVTYTADNILNWRYDVLDGRIFTTYVVLKEIATVIKDVDKETNPMGTETKETIVYRVLWLNNGVYTISLFEERLTSRMEKTFEETNRETPVFNGEFLDFIPFTPVTKNGVSWEIEPSLISKMVDVELSLYNNSADLEHALHLSGCPTPWVKGLLITEEGKPQNTLAMGSSSVIQLEIEGDTGFLEFSGQGVEPLRNELKDKQDVLARLGAKNIEVQRAAKESGESLQTQRVGEDSILGSLSISVSKAYTEILKMFYFLSTGKQDDNISYMMKSDFTVDILTPAEIQAHNASRDRGFISEDTYLFVMKEGGVLPPERTIEEEKQLIEEDKKKKAEEDAKNLELIPEEPETEEEE